MVACRGLAGCVRLNQLRGVSGAGLPARTTVLGCSPVHCLCAPVAIKSSLFRSDMILPSQGEGKVKVAAALCEELDHSSSAGWLYCDQHRNGASARCDGFLQPSIYWRRRARGVSHTRPTEAARGRPMTRKGLTPPTE